MDRLMYEALAQILANQRTMLAAFDRQTGVQELYSADKLTKDLVEQLRTEARAK